MPAYDLIIIGAGPGGYVAAIRAAQLGLRTAVVERQHLGGICLNWGCIPTKSLLHSAEVVLGQTLAPQFGVEPGEQAVSLSKMVERSRSVAGQLNAGVQFLLRKNKIDIIWGQAELAGHGHVRVKPTAGEPPKGTLPAGDYEAADIIVATGARERALPGIEPDGQRIWSYHHAMTARERPASLIVIGGGAIGVEFASFYAALGTKVTLVESMPRILPLEDAEIADLMAKALKKKGVEVVCGGGVTKVVAGMAGLAAEIGQAGGGVRTVEAERLLSAAGVVANIEGLGLERLGVELSNGTIRIDANGRTNVAGIHAIGDVAGPPMLAHKAEHEGVLCVEAIAGKSVHSALGAVPSCVYAHPQIASIGLTEEAASAVGRPVEIGRFSLRGNGKAVTLGETDGMVKVIFDGASRKVVGAHMIGPSVSELIAVFSLAMTLGATREQLITAIFPHPTISEAMHEAILASDGRAIHA
ncbi:dihydrolipoyl dehydrogenase [Mesorhizobium sp. SEMIA 3007]|uniref:dihydrolipoyl dehydrogenase n=1 Tax=Mesorhizobium sp. SEMIA 3007 TaxID=1862350 RepID=UPI00083CD8E5|nr:dihydrolipoyl dehydrogenase [Mesorhizobium sp. SEMIA 3007]ODA93769.1 dihydrolipoyl dehydrogenase [Mesorhizobium sp. SEMIA 3007]